MSGASKQGNDIYDLLINLILTLSPKQAGRLYSELLPRYSKSSRSKLYDEYGEINPDGKIRLMPFQYTALRTKFGDSYIKKSFTELTNYINWLEQHAEGDPSIKQKLKNYMGKNHNTLLSEGWVYQKCKQYISHEKPKINLNPYTIDDYPTAVEYLKSIPRSTWDTALDVKMLIMKFPQIVNDIKEQTDEQ